MNEDIELHIAELVLHGFEGHNAAQISEAVQHEVARMLAERGLPAAFSGQGQIAYLDAKQFNMQRHANADAVGNNIARSVYKSLQGEQPGFVKNRK